ncbi:hypothetical protein [Halobacteriovorax sp. HLS]|uniref:hypothetical protein n=1 Tax=Halobacteriovorax sp. HLS TaxID=2234000 RepID=UPI000FD89870|nr:hypothetical protein [Halobacteriovorax sp. HLS]
MPTQSQSLDSKDLVRDQLVSDLNEYFSHFKDRSLAQKSLAKKSGVHLKTIQRLCRRENNPGHITLLKIYKILLGQSDYQKLFSLLPDVVRVSLSIDQATIPVSTIDYSEEIRRELLTDKVFLEIYFLVDAGTVSRELIQFKFGENGLEILQKMLALNALSFNSEGMIVLGSQRVQLDPQIIKRAGLLLSSSYAKPVNSEVKGENFIGLYVESLPEQAYQKWLQIDKEAFLQKAQIAKEFKDNTKGKKVFTYMVTDSLIKGDNENYNH